MNQSRNNAGKAYPKGRNRRPTRSSQPARTQSNSPLDAITRGLVAIGERFFKGRAQLRIP